MEGKYFITWRTSYNICTSENFTFKYSNTLQKKNQNEDYMKNPKFDLQLTFGQLLTFD